MSVPNCKLSDKKTIPVLGFGTGTAWFKRGDNAATTTVNRALVDSLKSALKAGFTHLDTAEAYGTEEELGIAIKETGISPSSLFITTKVSKSIQDPVASLQASLKKLELESVNLFLIHSPFSFEKYGTTLNDAWRAMEATVDQGLAKSIGVSNFGIEDLQQVLDIARIKPVVNQIEFHPYLHVQTADLRHFCAAHKVLIEAYSPLAPLTQEAAKGQPVEAVVRDIAQTHGKSPAQVLIRWSIQKDAVPITTSSKVERQQEYLASTQFELTSEDMERIDDAGSQFHMRIYWEQNFPPEG
ncbi:NADP-dependent oxidoreductase domain-containing protein [Phlyctochytrium arcticum]|nr:NADP-dependent oxidoreductase domain-containing protein [Phlyctochytrium arcticum]